MPVGLKLQIYYLNEKEAIIIKKEKKLIYKLGFTSIALGTLAFTTDSLLRNLCGESCQKVSQKIFETGTYLSGIGLGTIFYNLTYWIPNNQSKEKD